MRESAILALGAISEGCEAGMAAQSGAVDRLKAQGLGRPRDQLHFDVKAFSGGIGVSLWSRSASLFLFCVLVGCLLFSAGADFSYRLRTLRT